MKEISEKAKEAQRAYLREWRRKNPEKVQENNRRYERAECVRSLRHRAREIMTTARALELAGLDEGQAEIAGAER